MDNLFKNSPLKRIDEGFLQITDREQYLSCDDDTYEDNFDNNLYSENQLKQKQVEEDIIEKNENFEISDEQQENQLHRRKQQRHHRQQNNMNQPYLVQINLQDVDSIKEVIEHEDYTFGNFRSNVDSGIAISASFGKQEKDQIISFLQINKQQQMDLKSSSIKFSNQNFEQNYDFNDQKNSDKLLNKDQFISQQKKQAQRISQPLPHKVKEYQGDLHQKSYKSKIQENISSDNSGQKQKLQQATQQPGMFDAVSQFITKLWGGDEEESKSNQFDNIEVFEIENEDGIYNFIDER